MRALLIFFVLVFSSHLYAQTGVADSLKALLATAVSDTLRARLCIRTAEAYLEVNFGDSVIHYATRAILLAKDTRRNDLHALGIHMVARGHHNRGEYAEAIAGYAQAVGLYRKYGLSYDTFRLHMNTAICNSAIGRADAAIAHLDTAGWHLPPENVRFRMMHASFMAVVLGDQNRHREALKYQQQALTLSVAEARPEDQMLILFRLAHSYGILRAPDSALIYLKRALPLAQQTGDRYMEWHIRGNIGMNLVKKGDFAAGLAAFREAEALEDKVGNNICCGNGAYQALALYKLGRGSEAARYLEQAESLPPRTPVESIATLPALLEVYEARGDFRKALETLKMLKIAEDSLARSEYLQHTADLEVRYRSREQEAALAEQEARLRRQRVFILVAVVIAGLLGALAYQYRRIGRIRKEAAAATEQQNRMLTALDAAKSRFFANISHEFRTPLTLILAPLQTVSESLRNPGLRHQLDMARRSAEQLLHLVEELLDLSKLEAGKLALREQSFRPASWLRRHLYAFESQAGMSRTTLRFETDVPDTLVVAGDADKLEKIVNNLVSNAIKYGKRGGEVVLSSHWEPVSEKQGTLRISVSDNGPGIRPEDLPHIFERYYQGGSPDAVAAGGVGLGLALAQELTQFLGGVLGVESRQGTGTIFTLTLPVRIAGAEAEFVPEPATMAPPEPVSAPYKPALDRGKARVLLVEDNADMRLFLEQVLGPYFDTESAGDGAAALRCLERRPPFDLVLSDVMMPNMDGFELLEHVRRHPTTFRHTPFVFLTARALDDDQLLGLRLGVDDYLLKPFQPDFLVARLQNLLQNHVSRQKQRGKVAEPDNAELSLMKQAEKTVLDQIDDPDLKIETLAKALNQSPRNLERLLKRLSGFTPVEFIRELRLQRAFQLLQHKRFRSVSEVRLAVGIENGAYFSRIFQKRFGVSPGDVLRGD